MACASSPKRVFQPFPSVHWVRLSFTFALALGLKTREPRRSPLAFSLSLEAM